MSEQSKYWAVSRAVTGDGTWRERLRIACILKGVGEIDERLLILVTAQCADHITVDDHGTVTTTAVTDAQIDTAIETVTVDVEDDGSSAGETEA